MNPEKIRIAIAEICGWTDCHSFVGEYDKYGRIGKVFGTHPVEHVSRELPNYPEDLNACHEMEKVLTREQRGHYEVNLCELSGVGLFARRAFVGEVFEVAYTEAKQRCEAFLRVFNKWEDGE